MLDSLTAAEFALWAAYYQRFGFDVDRLEWATANAGAAAGRAMGARVKPADLIPVFYQRKTGSTDGEIRAWFDWLARPNGGKE